MLSINNKTKPYIILACVPKLSLIAPLPGIAQLKSILIENGFLAKTIDINAILYHKCLDTNCRTLWDRHDSTFFYRNKYKVMIENSIFNKELNSIAKEIANISPEWFGVGLYGKHNLYTAVDLCFRIKQFNSNIKTVIGGPFVKYCGKNLLKYKLIDHYIIGDADKSLLELLKGNLDFPGIDRQSPHQFSDLDTLPFPNYDDYDFSNYLNLDDPGPIHPKSNSLYISGSRGCIFQCTYCEIKGHWKKFSQCSGVRIAKEMEFLHKKYKINKFIFTDNMVNGVPDELEAFCKEIITLKKQDQSINISWKGHFSYHSKKLMKDNFFVLLKQSGLSEFIFGVESGSERIRAHMRKPLTDVDLNFAMQELAKHNIKITLLMMVGYVTETEEDFQKTLEMFDRFLPYVNIINVYIGATLSISEDTYLYKNLSKLKIQYFKGSHDWIYQDNTPDVRFDRWFKLREHLLNNGYDVLDRQYDIVKGRQATTRNIDNYTKPLK